jgi:SM-20-related protein
MLSNTVDWARYEDLLRRKGRVQIPGFLQSDAAQALHVLLRDALPWTLALRDAEGSRTLPVEAYAGMDEDARRALYQKLALDGRGGAYRFAYDSYMMVKAYLQQPDADAPLHRVLEFLNSPQFIAFARQLTGEPRIRRVSAQATRFLGGQFLRKHEDLDEDEGRLLAYVINLSEDWQADWGGLLQFLGPDGGVIDTFLPRFNSLSLFRVPAPHIVSMVCPWADRPRLSITGWFQS